MSTSILDSILERLPENNRLERIWKLGKIEYKKRYYDSFLGLFWALLNPIFKLSIYYFVFAVVLNRKTENFALYIFLGFIFWMAFSESTGKSFVLLKSKRYLIENIQFNKLDLFYASILSVLIGLVFNLIAYFIISTMLGVSLTIYALWIPVLIINLILILLGVGLMLASISIFLKDLRMVWDLVLLAGFWATPIFFDAELLFSKAPFLRLANPMAGIIVNLRHVTMYGQMPEMDLILFDMAYSVVLVFIGLYLFRTLGKYAIEKI